MFGVFPLTPAYGRDYKSWPALVRDFEDGRDFQCVNGQYCSIRDFPAGTQVEFRYNRLSLEQAYDVGDK